MGDVGANVDAVLDKLVGLFSELPQVEAIVLVGSQANGYAETMSDIDLYMFTNAEIPLKTRRSIIKHLGSASKANLEMGFFDDAWLDEKTEAEFDVTYLGRDWFESQQERVWQQHQASLGYTTAFCYTLKQAQVLYDPNGWFSTLQDELEKPYPEPLRQNIVSDNHAILRNVIPSHFAQLTKAVTRNDLVSINRCLTALLASYFDILFAVNRALHPGEKRLVQIADGLPSLPEHFERNITETLTAVGKSRRLIPALTRQLDALDTWLLDEGFDVSASRPVPIAGIDAK